MRNVFFALCSLFLVSQAHAGAYNCNLTLPNGNPFVAAVSFNNPAAGELKVYQSVVTIAGKSIPMLGSACFASDRPGTRYIKCAHQSGNVRVEIYPEVETTSGALKVMQYIIWNGTTPTKGAFDNCSTTK